MSLVAAQNIMSFSSNLSFKKIRFSLDNIAEACKISFLRQENIIITR